MPVMEIVFSPSEKGVRGGNDFVTSCILLSKQKGVKCKLKPTKVVIEGDRETLLDILHEIDHAPDTKTEKISISLRVDESHDKPPTQAEINL